MKKHEQLKAEIQIGRSKPSSGDRKDTCKSEIAKMIPSTANGPPGRSRSPGGGS